MITRDDVRGFALSANEVRGVNAYLPKNAGSGLVYNRQARRRALDKQEAMAAAAASLPSNTQVYTIITADDADQPPERYWQIEDEKTGEWWLVQIVRVTAANALFHCIVTPRQDGKAQTGTAT